jgi:hypothetical protein
MATRPEQEESLWWLALSPALWLVHFVACYATVALWCAKAVARAGGLGAARTAVVIYTLLALAAVIAAGVRSYRRQRSGGSKVPHDADTPEDRHRFLGLASFLLSALSAVAILYVALPFFFIETCR